MAVTHAVKPQSRLFELNGQKFFWEYQQTEMATWGVGVGLFHYKASAGGYVQVAIADEYPFASLPAPYTKDLAGQRAKLMDDIVKNFNEQLDVLAPPVVGGTVPLYANPTQQAQYEWLLGNVKIVGGKFVK